MERIELMVLGLPMAQARHRDFKLPSGQRIKVDPHKQAKADFLTLVQSKAPSAPWDCPCRLIARFYFPWSKAHHVAGKASRPLKATAPHWYYAKGKFDIDNLAKFVMDALNTIFFLDDGLIASAHIEKRYDLRPRTEIILEKLDNEVGPMKGLSDGKEREGQHQLEFCERVG